MFFAVLFLHVFAVLSLCANFVEDLLDVAGGYEEDIAHALHDVIEGVAVFEADGLGEFHDYIGAQINDQLLVFGFGRKHSFEVKVVDGLSRGQRGLGVGIGDLNTSQEIVP